MEMIPLIVIIVMFGVLMWWQMNAAKKQQAAQQSFRANLKPGTEVVTIGGFIGKVVEVDEQYEEIVLDSEGTKLRVSFNAIAKEYTRPAYVSDDEVDENGNPLPKAEEAAEAAGEQVKDEAQEAAGQVEAAGRAAAQDAIKAAHETADAVQNGVEAK